jgi:hypothetical protein
MMLQDATVERADLQVIAKRLDGQFPEPLSSIRARASVRVVLCKTNSQPVRALPSMS